MQDGVLSVAARSNGFHRAGVPLSVCTSWSVKKRDGQLVPFYPKKIEVALLKCFRATDGVQSGDPLWEGEAAHQAQRLVAAVINQIAGLKKTEIEVEEVQRLVIQQLWATGQFEYAEHYQNYREDRRKARLHKPIPPEVAAAIAADAKRFSSPLQYFQFIDKYARWREKDRRRETWRECCDRVMTFFRKQPQLSPVTEEEWRQLDTAFYDNQVSPAMRVVQMAGPALDRCNSGGFNCCYAACDDFLMFPETLYLLMQGCGVGFSVEKQYTECLPRITKQKGGSRKQICIADSTEGWCDAYKEGLIAWAAGEDVEYDYSGIRKAGSRLKTKGGRASGPEPLKTLLEFARNLFLRRQGRRLTSKDCHDLLCTTGKIVQVGGVRRASEISLSDLDDYEMRDAKKGSWWERSPWLDMANNSAVYEEKPDALTFMDEWMALARSGSGERGIFNRDGVLKQIPTRRKPAVFGMNPCGEVLLRSRQMCNLSIVVARYDDTPKSLEAKVALAAVFGTLQATLTNFTYLREEWKRNCDEERLLGVDITGQMDCPLLRPGAPGRDDLLRHLQSVVLKTNESLSRRLGINPSAAATVVKPSGNSAAFFGCSSGLHARWSTYQVRRVRVVSYNPLAKLLVAEGVPHAVDPMNDTLLVFDFLPDPAPVGTPTRNELTAVEQFYNWLCWKTHWTEHNPSCTIYVGDAEWLELGTEVYKHFDKIGGLSFLPRDSGTYRLAPNEELTAEEYRRRKASFPDIRWERLAEFEVEDTTTPGAESACLGGVCEVQF